MFSAIENRVAASGKLRLRRTVYNTTDLYSSKMSMPGFPGDPVVKSPPCNVENTSSISGLGRFHTLRSN